MADIRQNTTVRDDFNRADENPVASPWAQPLSGVMADMELDNNQLEGTATPPSGSLAYWTTESWDGNDAEVWAEARGTLSTTEGYRIGLIADPGTSTMDGYVCLPSNNVGTDTWDLRKYTDGSFTTPASATIPPAPALPSETDLVLMRRSGNDVEVWISTDDGANWTFAVSITDTAYTSGLYAALGTTGNVMGWDNFGGGPHLRRTQIYRYVSN